MEGHADTSRLNHADIQHFRCVPSLSAVSSSGTLRRRVVGPAELLTLTARTVIYLAGLDAARPAVNTGIGAKCGK
jgi:hypothetical protein